MIKQTIAVLCVILIFIDGPLNLAIYNAGFVTSSSKDNFDDPNWWPCKDHNCGCSQESCLTQCCCRKPVMISCCPSEKSNITEESVSVSSTNLLARMACQGLPKNQKEKVVEIQIRVYTSLEKTTPYFIDETTDLLLKNTQNHIQKFLDGIFRPPKKSLLS